MSFKLSKSAQACTDSNFQVLLLNELGTIEQNNFPLNAATLTGGYIADNSIKFIYLSHNCKGNTIEVHLGVYFTEIVICCGCGDDPQETLVYRELLLKIDSNTYEASMILT